jgi:hypothetical protein
MEFGFNNDNYNALIVDLVMHLLANILLASYLPYWLQMLVDKIIGYKKD